MSESVLSPFDGQPVTRSAIAVTRAGDGLSEALKVDPAEFHLGQEVYVVLRTTVARVNFDPADKANPEGDLVRRHTLRAEDATILDDPDALDTVRGHVAAQADRILRAKEEAAGIQRIDFADDPDPDED